MTALSSSTGDFQGPPGHRYPAGGRRQYEKSQEGLQATGRVINAPYSPGNDWLPSVWDFQF